MYGGDEVSGIVLDIGSFTTRAGYAGEDSPKVVIPSLVGVPCNPDAMDLDNPKYIVGDTLSMRRDYVDVHEIMNGGTYTNLPLVEQLIGHSVEKALMLKPFEHPFLMAEPNIHSRESRIALTEMIFEKFNVPALYFVKSAVLSSFASGRSTSLVLDSGARMTFSVPVHDGYVLHKSIVRYEVGGELLTEMLQRHLESTELIKPRYSFKKHIKTYAEAGEQTEVNEFKIEDLSYPNTTPSFHNFAVRDIIRDIKESNFKVSDSPYSDSSFANVPTVSYELPDGKVIELGNERFKFPELLFNNSAPLSNGIVGFSGLHQMVNDSITRCEMDIRKELYGNVVIAGGNTLFPGFTDRLTRRLNDIASNMKVKLIASNSSIERRFSSWIGGSILASLGSFQQMWMSKQEYSEHGAGIVERKCP
mmetsp:Transcript_33924/g.59133  ORF Transcript_33924/g.59133 Transcript_33924/m.59133 type:complete len:418 (+) Transcript_33924:44-1297(+)